MTDAAADPRIASLLSARNASSVEDLISARYGFARPRVDGRAVAGLLDALPTDAEACGIEQAVVEAAVVGETYFLRHRAQIAWLTDRWVPALRARPSRRPIQILAAGCSTGEEVWSLLSRVGPLLADVADIRLVALDVSARALAVAEGRRYRAWSLRGVDLEAESSWLEVDALGTARVADHVARHAIEFVRHNLQEPLDDLSPAGGFDLILCRNVLLYFDVEGRARVWDHLLAARAPDGVLLTATTDPAPTHRTDVHRRWEGPVPLIAPGPGPAAAAPSPPPVQTPSRRPPRVRSVSRPAADRPAVPPPPRPLADPRGALGLAERFASTGRPRLARSLLEEQLVTHPEDVGALLLIALLASELDDHAAAIAPARKAAYLAPSDAYPAYVMSVVLGRSGSDAQAARRRASARDLLAGLEADAPLAHADGLTAGQLRTILDSA